MIVTRYLAKDRKVMPWTNGGGTTTELARDTADEDCGWRLSIADIAQDGQFSTFAGMQRIVTVLQGSGMRLTSNGGTSGDLLPFEAYAFDGGAGTSCALLGDPVQAFNLMYRKVRFTARLEWLVFPGSRTFSTDATTVLFYNIGPETGISVSKGPKAALGTNELLRIDNTAGPADIALHTAKGGHCAIIELWQSAARPMGVSTGP